MEVIGVGRPNIKNKKESELILDDPTISEQIIHSPNHRTKNQSNESSNIDQNLHLKQDQLLYESLYNGSYDQYNEAILLSQYRDSLLEQAMALRQDIENDIEAKSKRIKPIIYGRKHAKPFDNNVKELDYEGIWNSLRNFEAYEYGLEDPQIYEEFFDEMKDLWVKNDLPHIKKEVVETYCPWLLPKKEAFKNTKSKKVIRQYVPSERKKTTSQLRMERDLSLKEEELQKSLNLNFKANPIPESSLEKRYDHIMSAQGTKTTKEREILAKTKLHQIVKHKVENARKKQVVNPIISKAVLATSKKKKHAYKDEELTFQPKITSHIPDYQKLHYKFISKLQARKNSKSLTIVKPFKSVEMNEILAREKRLKAEEKLSKNIANQIKSTKAREIESKQKEKVPEPRKTLSTILRVKDREMKAEVEQLIQQVTKEVTAEQQLKQQVT